MTPSPLSVKSGQPQTDPFPGGLGALLPATYFISLLRAIILRGAEFIEYWPNLAILIGISILLFCVCALRFRKKIG